MCVSPDACLSMQLRCASPHSAAQVYGDPLEHPQRETYWGNVNPIGERSCYDEGAKHAAAATHEARRGRAALSGRRLTLPTRSSPAGKRAAECLTMDYHREHGLEVRQPRPAAARDGEGQCVRRR